MTRLRFALRKLRPSATESKLGNLEDWESVSEPLEVTAVSRIRGTQRIQEDTKGHGEVGGGVLEDTGGAAGIPEDTTLGRFGTVRPRVQIPRPRPFLEYESNVALCVLREPASPNVVTM